MKKLQDFKEEIEIFFGLFIVEPIMIVIEIISEKVDKILRRKKCGDEV